MSEHPELNEYLSSVLNSIRELIKEDENSVKAINLTFYNKTELPIEKFVFDMAELRANFVEYVNCQICVIAIVLLNLYHLLIPFCFKEGSILSKD